MCPGRGGFIDTGSVIGGKRFCTKGHIMIYLVVCALLVCLLKQRPVYGMIPSAGTESTSTVCYEPNATLSARCTASRIAITGFYYGFKLDSADCSTNGSCCKYVESTDCLETVTTDWAQLEALSGRTDGTIATSNIARQSCNSSYWAISTYNLLKTQCIDSIRIYEMCTSVSSTSTYKEPIYLWNQGYPNIGIFAEDTSCTCSVEASSLTADINLYIIHMELYDDPTNCFQSIIVSDESGSVLHTFQCETPEFNTIQTVTVQGPYITVNMDNAYTATGGKFWIGFEATEQSVPMSINCPAAAVPDCGDPTSGEYSTVATSSTLYGSIATYTCSVNFVTKSGNLQRFCLQNGSWNGTALNCIYECGSPPSPGNGSVTANSSVTNGQATYACNEGFTLTGNIQRACIDRSGWSGTLPLCHPDCGFPDTGPHSTVSTSVSSPYGTTVDTICEASYTRESGDKTRHCGENGQWNGTALSCIYECGSPPSPGNGSVTASSIVTNGKATYTCNEGLTLTGNMHRVCIEGSGWNGTLSVCHPDCGSPDIGSHSTLSTTAVSPYGTIVNTTCEADYTRERGDKSRHCGENGQWNGTALSCIYECGSPPSPGNGSVTANSSVTNGQATYTCSEGFTLTGNMFRVCIDGSGWNGTLPVCHPDCGIPDTGPHSPVPTTADSPYGTIVNTTCEANYTRDSGDETRHCGENGQWNGTALSCIYECGSPPGPGNGSVTANSIVTNGQATHTCNEGFTLTGSMFRVCIDGSGWNGTLSVCHPDCGIPGIGYHSAVPTAADSPYGTIVNTTCEANYTRESGDETRYCRENGQWNGTALSCVYDCGSPPRPGNGSVIANSSVANGHATFTCSEGFTLTGSMHRVCIDGSGWDGSLSVCHPDCGNPTNGECSTVTTSSIIYGSIATYKCSENFVYKSGNMQRYCLHNGQWNGSVLVCTDGSTRSTQIDVWTAIGAAIGALAVGTLIGAAGVLFCYRLKKHRAQPTNQEMKQIGMRRQDGQNLSSEMHGTTPEINDISTHEYQTLRFDNVDPDHTYTALSS